MPGQISKIEALIKIVPKGSQVVLLALVFVLALCVNGLISLMLENLNFWPLLGLVVMLLAAIVFLWLQSYRSVDDGTLPPVDISVSDGTKSAKLSIHPRASPFSDQLKLLERAFSAMHNRKPLPDPDGLVDENGVPVPSSEVDARQKVDLVNEELIQMLGAIGVHVDSSDQKKEAPVRDRSAESIVEQSNKYRRSNDDGLD